VARRRTEPEFRGASGKSWGASGKSLRATAVEVNLHSAYFCEHLNRRRARLRVALVTRRFWPVAGPVERNLAQLVTGLTAAGIHCTVITAQWQADWPVRFHFAGAPVIRLPNPPQIGWGTYRYTTALSKWLREHCGDFDIVCVSRLARDAGAVISSLGQTGKPAVLRCEATGVHGDCTWQAGAQFGGSVRRKCQQASAIVATSVTAQEELAAAGYNRSHIHLIENGATAGETQTSRAQARKQLRDSQPRFQLRESSPLAIYNGLLHREQGLFDLVEAWRLLHKQLPQARLWILGDGPDRRILQRQINEAEIEHRVLLPGTFDDSSGLLRAADAFVLPAREEEQTVALREAFAAGISVVASDLPGFRRVAGDSVMSQFVPPSNPPALSSALLAALRNAPCSPCPVTPVYTSGDMVAAHLRLFKQLLGQ